MTSSESSRVRSPRARRHRRTVAAAAAGLCTLLAGCAGAPVRPERDPDARPERREVVLDRGAGTVVDLRSAAVQARPGDMIVVRSANPGRGRDDESPVHHLFTSAPPSSPPPLFIPAGRGHVPNPGVWGLCRGGDSAGATAGCPVPPAEGPSAYDGRSYFSLGALLPGEARELPLAPDLPSGSYRFTCAVHPGMHVDVEVVDDPAPAPDLQPLASGAAITIPPARDRSDAVVVLGPKAAGMDAEVLTASPRTVTLPLGGTVTWRVEGRSPHTVELGIDRAPHLADTTAGDTAPVVPAGRRWDGNGVVRSGILSTDPGVDRGEFSLTFTEPGSYTAYDRFHADIVTRVRIG